MPGTQRHVGRVPAPEGEERGEDVIKASESTPTTTTTGPGRKHWQLQEGPDRCKQQGEKCRLGI